MRATKRQFSFTFLALTLAGLVASCSGGSEPRPSPRPTSPAQRIVDPQVIYQAQPDLADADAEALLAHSGTIRVALRLNVSRDGAASDVRIVSAEPSNLPIARAFAEAVQRSIPQWKFRPAMRAGQPVDAEMSLMMEADGGATPAPAN